MEGPARAQASSTELYEAPPPRDYDAPAPQRTITTYLRAAAGTAFTAWLVWQYDWIVDKVDVYYVTGHDIRANVRHGFTFDDDSLAANLFGHPYGGGAGFFGAARATGLSFWEAAPYVAMGSVFWEYTSESQYPSTNDFVSTTLGGIAIGEMLYRISSLALDDSRSGFARLSRELLGAVISPGRGATRAASSEAWADGPPPLKKPARIAAHLGADQVRAGSSRHAAFSAPSALFAVDVEYGDWLPNEGTRRLAAYDAFDFYGSAVLSSQQTSGLELETSGLLHGWSSDLSEDDRRAHRDNQVLGFVQSMDYQGSDLLRFGAFGLGLGDTLVIRAGAGQRLRLSLDASWAPLAGATSPFTPYADTGSPRDYNFSMGASVGLLARWDIGRFGQLGLRSREYITGVIDGDRGRELLGHLRGWYEIDLIPRVVGLGLAPRFIHRTGVYTEGRHYNGTQLSMQLYMTVRW
jgi:hypothetical protein